MQILKSCIKSIKGFFNELTLNCKFLIFLLILSLPIICMSIFDANLHPADNLVSIRTAFSTIVGYVLQQSTSSISQNNALLKNKIIIVGFFAITSMTVIIFAYIFNSDMNNPSILLLKNLLFSSIGYLTSAKKDS